MTVLILNLHPLNIVAREIDEMSGTVKIHPMFALWYVGKSCWLRALYNHCLFNDIPSFFYSAGEMDGDPTEAAGIYICISLGRAGAQCAVHFQYDIEHSPRSARHRSWDNKSSLYDLHTVPGSVFSYPDGRVICGHLAQTEYEKAANRSTTPDWSFFDDIMSLLEMEKVNFTEDDRSCGVRFPIKQFPRKSNSGLNINTKIWPRVGFPHGN